LIIMAALDDGLAAEIEAEAMALGMDALIEVHDETELERALNLQSPLLGINNRNLKTFETDLATTERLAVRVPGDYRLVSESGIFAHADLERLADHGVRAFLVGESLMRQQDIAAATAMLLTGHGG
ncbi:MAG: indole-3-glycerol-phosphate synthase TrpC, partial [Sphingomonadaceae bacterium]|nr:indole-3-glycerol-phosphate synthase TrpC [Sphingomonadaceae bacterium]